MKAGDIVVVCVCGFIGGTVGMLIKSLVVEWMRSRECRKALTGLLIHSIVAIAIAVLVLLVFGGES